MLPDIALSEMVGSERPEVYFDKLNGLVFHPTAAGRIVVGRYWNDISNDERHPSDVVPHSIAAAHVELTRNLLQAQRARRLFTYTPGGDDTEQRRAGFLKLVNGFSAWMQAEHPERVHALRGDPEALPASIKGPTAFMGKLIIRVNPRYDTPAWRAAANTFPDKCAAARWMRTICWYANLRVSLPDQSDEKFGNNYEDAHYVFLSLYTGHLWTRDRQMARAALGVSGGRVAVHREL